MSAETPLESVTRISVPLTIIKIMANSRLRVTALRCIAAIFHNFFFRQYRSAFLPGLVPVSRADHLLDGKIPFMPGKVHIYLDFVGFWIRCLGFLLKNCGHRAVEPVRNFMETMGRLYAFAAEIYKKNLSTTERPFYIARPRFLLIHMADPHLMCIPSLHVMIVIRTYTLFREIAKSLGEEGRFAFQTEELRRGALAITEAVLYVKQHSVNCIPAALYTMSKFEPDLFPPAEAERFTADLFVGEAVPGKEDAGEIKAFIVSMYRRFLSEGGNEWQKPLLDFLKTFPRLE